MHRGVRKEGPVRSPDQLHCITYGMLTALSRCVLATFTGTCYLKKSDKGDGFVKTGSQQNRVAVNLARWNGNDAY